MVPQIDTVRTVTSSAPCVYRIIDWRCFLRVKNRDKARRLVTRMRELLATPLTMDAYERYWKIPELAVAELTSPVHPEGPLPLDAAFLRSLQLAQRLGGPWSVAPVPDEPGDCFAGHASENGGGHFSLPGPVMITFDVTPDTAAST